MERAPEDVAVQFRVRVIGRIRTPFAEAVGTPIQPAYAAGAEGHVVVDEAFAGGLDDLGGFERVWLIYWMDMFDLTEVAGNYLDTYSHGMQQKVAITGAFLHDPQIVFMDEPTVGLDPRSARLIKDLMIRNRDRGRTIFFSTHILEIAQTMCDRVIIINKGRIVADARVDELRAMRGEQTLEDIFLELTGGTDVDDMVKELGDVA